MYIKHVLHSMLSSSSRPDTSINIYETDTDGSQACAQLPEVAVN